MGGAGALVSSIVVAFIGLTIVSVVLSQSANTSNVLTSFGTALSSIINAAVSPITGGSSGSAFGSTT